MRRFLLALLLLSVGGPASAQEKSMHRTWPLVLVLTAGMFPGVPASGGELPEPLRLIGSDWTAEVSRLDANGDAVELSLANARVEYVLYSRPRSSMYDVSYYRVGPTKKTGLFAPDRGPYEGREAVLWLQILPGTKTAVRIFRKTVRRPWWLLGVVRLHRWQELVPQSPEWQREQGIGLRVMSVHALIKAYGEDAASLEF